MILYGFLFFFQFFSLGFSGRPDDFRNFVAG